MKLWKKLAIAAASAAALSALSGCSALNVGEEEFACNGMPGSVYCHSARDVYEMTNDGMVPAAIRKDGAYNEDCVDCVKAEDVNPELRAKMGLGKGERIVETEDGNTVVVAGSQDEIINNYVSPALPDHPVPIRTPAQVMRIWIAPYVDTTGDLIAPGFVYTEVEPRRWIYPDHEIDSANASRMFSPLKAADQSTRPGADARYATPKSYSDPAAVRKRSSSENSLLKFRKNKAETLNSMKVN